MIYSLVLGAQVYACSGAMRAGTVSGRVMGPSGHPIPNARVYALYTNSPGPGRQTEVLADGQGNFLLKNVRAGRNEIHAYAPGIGYPNNLFAFFQTAPVPVVRLRTGERLRGIVVQLGQKPGTLSGRIVDENTRKPLPTASIVLTRIDRPEFYIRSSVEPDGRFIFKVPDHPFRVTVACGGYRTWKSRPVTVRQGEIFPMTIRMEKSGK